MRAAHERRTGQISPTFPGRRAALVIAHPGHELRVQAWVELAQPLAFVLTDGSGHTGRSRLASTSRLLDQTGASSGGIYGRLTDRALYAAILGGDVDLFAGLARDLVQALVDERIDYVVGDAFEGHNPGHDLCRVIIDAAAELAGRAGQRVACLDFPLVGRPDECPPALAAEAISLALDDAAFARKLAAMHAYAELAGEVAATFAETGLRLSRMGALAGGSAPLSSHPPIRGRRPCVPRPARLRARHLRGAGASAVQLRRPGALRSPRPPPRAARARTRVQQPRPRAYPRRGGAGGLRPGGHRARRGRPRRGQPLFQPRGAARCLRSRPRQGPRGSRGARGRGRRRAM